MRPTPRLATVLLFAAAALMPATARAGGFAATRFGGEHGHPATDDPTAVYYNPAGLAYGHGTRILVEGLFVYRTADYTRDPGDIDKANPTADEIAANSGDATLANTIVSPFLGVATDFGVEGLGVGLGVFAPFGGQTAWDKADQFEGNTQFPGAVDGSARWSSIEAEQRSVYFALGGGWRTKNGRFGVGASFNFISSNLLMVRARNIDGSDNLLNSQGGVQEGRALLDLKNKTFSVGVGVMVKPTECSRVGLSYQSQPGFGELGFAGTLTNQYGASAPFTVDVEMRQTLPDSVRLGGEWDVSDKLSLHGALEYQRWSVFTDQCLVQTGLEGGAKCSFEPATGTGNRGPLAADGKNVLVNIARDWKDTYGIRAGGSYHVNDKLELNGGLLFDSNAVPDETLEPALIDMNKIIAQAGSRYEISKKLTLNTTLGYVGYFARETSPRSPALDAVVAPNRNPDMAGKFDVMVAYLLVGLGVQL